MVNLAFRSDNQGKKGWHTLSQLRKKSAPLPRGNVDPSHMSSEALAALSTLIDGGWGRMRERGRPLRAVKECYVPSRFSIVSTVIVVLNCIKCANYYFP